MTGEGGVDAGHRIHYAQAVRPDDAHLAARDNFRDLPLEFLAFFAVLLEAGGNNDRRPHTDVDALLN